MLFMTRRTSSRCSLRAIIIISHTRQAKTRQPRTLEPIYTMFAKGSAEFSKTWVFRAYLPFEGVARVSKLLVLKEAHFIDSQEMLYLFFTKSK